MHSSWRTAGLHWDGCLEGPISKSKMHPFQTMPFTTVLQKHHPLCPSSLEEKLGQLFNKKKIKYLIAFSQETNIYKEKYISIKKNHHAWASEQSHSPPTALPCRRVPGEAETATPSDCRLTQPKLESSLHCGSQTQLSDIQNIYEKICILNKELTTT